MLIIIESPEYSNHTMSYGVSGDILTVTVNGVMDWIDFSQFPDGEAFFKDVDSILPVDPFFNIKKVDGVTTVTLRRFYGDDEKEVFESGYDTQLEIPFGIFG